MRKADLENECRKRNVWYEGTLLKDVRNAFLSHMCGVVRVPSYRFKHRMFSFIREIVKLLEISPVAPLHDIKGHIQHLLAEMAHILNEGENIIKYILLTI